MLVLMCCFFVQEKTPKSMNNSPTMRRGSRRKPWWTSFVRWREVGPGGWAWRDQVPRWGWLDVIKCHPLFFFGGDQTIHTYDYVVVSNIFHVHPYLGKWSNLTNIFQMCWHHQLDDDLRDLSLSIGSMYDIFTIIYLDLVDFSGINVG